MDITPGIFKDSPDRAETQRILSNPAPSTRPSSFNSSLELLTPELVNKTRPRSVETPSSLKSTTVTSSDKPNSARTNYSASKSAKQDEYEEKMKRAIQKMKKLDKILIEKIHKEKQIKLQRLQNERSLHEEMSQFKFKSSEQTDVLNNATKYLALLPPLQQINVLIEKCESADEFTEPFFQTQFPDEFADLKSNNIPRSKSSAAAPTSKEKPEDKAKNKQQSKSSQNSEDSTTDFIKRNIELVKDAGNLILMTPEEKLRLSELLKDLDTDENTACENDGDCDEEPSKTVSLNDNLGYKPEGTELDRLNEIDKALLDISDTQSVYGGSSMGNLEGTESSLGDIKSNLGEVFNPTKRFEEIEERLNRLDREWKEKFEDEDCKLDEETLQRLLSQYAPALLSSRTTQPPSRLTDQLDLQSSHDTNTSLFSTENDQLSNISFQSSTNLTRDQLDELLYDARNSLGLSQQRPNSVDIDDDDDQSVIHAENDICLQSIDGDSVSDVVTSCSILSPSPIDR